MLSEISIKHDESKGNVWSYVRSKWLVETPEETVRQEYLLVLVNEYGFALEQIGEEMDLTGGSFPIHDHMYEAIAFSDIIICDLTGHRPNVYVEAGYALKHHERKRLIFFFEPESSDDKVPFDLNTFKYVELTQAAEIPNKLMPELKSILQSPGAVL